MMASSGQTGACKNSLCKHFNNEHNTYKCKAKGCRKRWKICQTGVHDTVPESGKYVICGKCHDHPAGGPDGFMEYEDLSEVIIVELSRNGAELVACC